jgi:hypothetical protein
VVDNTMRYILTSVVLCMFAAGAPTIVRTEGVASSYLVHDRRAHDFLVQMDHKFGLENAFLGTRPMLRSDVAGHLYRLKSSQTHMTPTERGEYACLIDEFRGDFLNSGRIGWTDKGPVEHLPDFLRGFMYRNRKNLFNAVGPSYSLFVDPVVAVSSAFGDNHEGDGDNLFTVYNGFRVRGTVGARIGYLVDVRDGREWGDRTYGENTSSTLPGRGFVARKDDLAEFDETYTSLAYTNGPFVVSLERNRARWGRGERGTLLLSDYGAPYDMLRIEARFWRLRFTSFTGELHQYPEIARFHYYDAAGAPTDSVAVSKHISGHRVELNVSERLSIGLQEAVVYGGRWDLTYANPLMFLKGGEHTNGDHDNAAMGADFRFRLHRSHSIYGELLLDDLTTGKLGSDWYGNKLGWQLGTFILEPFGLSDLDCRIEYSRLRPWVYSHYRPINSFTHFGDVLGHRAGPNADELFAVVRKRFSRRVHSSFSFMRGRHGANTSDTNVGGDPLAGFENGDSTSALFLAGDVAKTNAVAVDVTYEPFWELFIGAGYMYEDVDGDGRSLVRFSVGLNSY